MGSFWGINVGERERIKADDCGKNYRRNGHMLCSLKFANVQVLPLSRRKQGFESPRERQIFQSIGE
jgi:hypothetical protein